MKAQVLTKIGKSKEAFELQDVEIPIPQQNEVLIKVEAFGLNYADVMARNGMYQDAPPLPSILGYDVVGTVEEVGSEKDKHLIGKRITALTRFGGYAQYAIASNLAFAEIGNMEVGKAAALTTQYCTAYHCACSVTTIPKGGNILIHAAAGGVGTALTQLGIMRGAKIFGLTSSDKKLDYLKQNGVTHPINYSKSDYVEQIQTILKDEKIDVAFNSVGGSTFRKDLKLLAFGGRIICYGAAEMSGARFKMVSQLKFASKFGLYSPIQFLIKSQGFSGVNMLKVADYKPKQIQDALENVVQLVHEGKLNPQVGGEFTFDKLYEAHDFLESRKSTGKIIVKW